MTESVLEVRGLTKDYGAYRAVDHISFDIKRGQVMGLLGPNGAGKSTTIQMLIGVTLPTAGSICYFGQDFARNRQSCLQRINYASAYNALQQRITVLENLRVFAGLYNVKNAASVIAELLDYFAIGRLADRTYRELSAGERTRVNLIKALLNNPELILMDEPTASLDPDIADKMLSLIERLRSERQLSILFTSHNMAEVARLCDEVIFLDRGSIVSQDTPTNHTKRFSEVSLKVQYKGPQQAVAKVLLARKLTHQFSGSQTAEITIKASDVGATIAAIQRADIDIQDVEVTKRTLEDVFLEIARKERV